ncbi:MAG: hypothetical protein AVDCRST_MAG44-582, partial [uncultured Sphingomonas sp.]
WVLTKGAKATAVGAAATNVTISSAAAAGRHSRIREIGRASFP